MTSSKVVWSDLGIDDEPKKLAPFGLSVAEYRSGRDARGYTYTTRDDGFPPTPFIFDANPFNRDILASNNVLEIGSGVGRNLPFVMEKTLANYYTVDPNENMLKYFWDVQDHKWKARVELCKDFNELPEGLKFDFVIVTFVFQHIGFRPSYGEMNVTDITKEAMKHTREGTIWFVMEHEREELWQERWLKECNITPEVYLKPGGDPFGGGVLIYPEFEPMTHRGNDNNVIVFRERK